jgi:hypothetical protein
MKKNQKKLELNKATLKKTGTKTNLKAGATAACAPATGKCGNIGHPGTPGFCDDMSMDE